MLVAKAESTRRKKKKETGERILNSSETIATPSMSVSYTNQPATLFGYDRWRRNLLRRALCSFLSTESE